ATRSRCFVESATASVFAISEGAHAAVLGAGAARPHRAQPPASARSGPASTTDGAVPHPVSFPARTTLLYEERRPSRRAVERAPRRIGQGWSRRGTRAWLPHYAASVRKQSRPRAAAALAGPPGPWEPSPEPRATARSAASHSVPAARPASPGAPKGAGRTYRGCGVQLPRWPRATPEATRPAVPGPLP